MDVLCRLPRGRELDLVYLDPPYGVGAAMTARTKKGEARGRRREQSGPVAYDDARSVPDLVDMIVASVDAARERMSARAALFLHLDQRAVHDAKVALDRLLGRGAFAGELIWAPGNGAKGRGVPVTHQTILVYARGAAERRGLRWHATSPLLREPYAATSLAMHFQRRDEDGRRFRERTIAGKTYRYFADEGRRLGSVWTDIPAMSANTPLLGESTGYPTQKPLKLLERIVLCASSEGDTVGDLMCGSGTTLVAAARHRRAFIGGDESATAISVTKRRLEAAGVPFRLV